MKKIKIVIYVIFIISIIIFIPPKYDFLYKHSLLTIKYYHFQIRNAIYFIKFINFYKNYC